MTTLTCSKCGHEFHTSSPQIWQGDTHLGCGGRYYREDKLSMGIEKELQDPILEQTAKALDKIFGNM